MEAPERYRDRTVEYAGVVGVDLDIASAYPVNFHEAITTPIGSTTVRAVIGDLDEWCSVQQVQAQIHAMQLSGGAATVRVVPGAHHSFDRHEPVHTIAEASVAPAAPTTMLRHDRAMLAAGSDRPDPDLVDGDIFRACITAGFYAATIGRAS